MKIHPNSTILALNYLICLTNLSKQSRFGKLKRACPKSESWYLMKNKHSMLKRRRSKQDCELMDPIPSHVKWALSLRQDVDVPTNHGKRKNTITLPHLRTFLFYKRIPIFYKLLLSFTSPSSCLDMYAQNWNARHLSALHTPVFVN